MKNYKSKVLGLLLTVGLALVSVQVEAAKLRIATEGAYPPFNFIDSNGKPQGFDVDIANALCETLKIDCVIVTQDWDGIITGLLVKKYDAAIASISITEERLKKIDFTDPYYRSGLAFIAKKSSKTNVSSVKGMNIGAQRSTIASIYANKHLSANNKIRMYDTQENLYLDVKSGRVDAFVSDMLPAYEWLKTSDSKDYEIKGEAFNKDDKIGIAVRKNSPLTAKFNKALKTIVDNGTYAKINAKYFPFSIY